MTVPKGVNKQLQCAYIFLNTLVQGKAKDLNYNQLKYLGTIIY